MQQVRKKREEILEQNEKLADEQYTRLMDNIRSFRLRRDISLADLAVKTQTYPSYLNRVENAQINTSVKKLMVILDAMGLELKIQSKKGLDLEHFARDLKAFNESV